jgi:photosystem II stability/assembly factor-like uncharacterized protein
VVDLTWVSDSMGWALAAVPCAGLLCAAVAATTDGGATWEPLPRPPVSLDSIARTQGPLGIIIPETQGDCEQAGSCVNDIRFATAKIGYLFGPSLFMTVDGGETWQAVISPPVESLEAAGGDVFRVVYDHDGCPGPCDRTVEEAPAGSDDWRTLLQIPGSLQIPVGALDTASLILQGSRTIYLPIYGNPAGGEPFTTLLRSLDGGQSWQQLADPCVSTTIVADSAIDFAAAPGGYLAALCYPNNQPEAMTVVTSDDSGSSWGPQLAVPGSSWGLIASPSVGTLVVGPGPGSGGGPATSTATLTMSVSADGGKVWTTAAIDQVNLSTAPLGVSLWLGFEDGTTGRWVGDDQTIWTTTDGGTRWTPQAFVVG